MKLQTIIIDRLTAKAEKRGYVVANNSDYANTGWMLFMDQALTTKFSLKYDFQVKHYAVRLYEGKPGGTKEPVYINRRENEAGEVIASIAEFLPLV